MCITLHSKWTRIGSWIFHPDYFFKPPKRRLSIRLSLFQKTIWERDAVFFMSSKQGFGQFFMPFFLPLLFIGTWKLVVLLLGIIAPSSSISPHFMTCNKYFSKPLYFLKGQGDKSDIKNSCFLLKTQEPLFRNSLFIHCSKIQYFVQ